MTEPKQIPSSAEARLSEIEFVRKGKADTPPDGRGGPSLDGPGVKSRNAYG
jgi:hypothetical protein